MYGEEDDDETDLLIDRLEGLIRQIDAKIEDVKTKERKLKQLPRGKMMIWDTNVESYHDWKHQMSDLLIYDSETLRLSTLKDQIKGKDKSFIN